MSMFDFFLVLLSKNASKRFNTLLRKPIFEDDETRVEIPRLTLNH